MGRQMMFHPRTIDFRKLAKEAALAADEKKALDIVALDIRKDSDVADYMVIAGADSTPQMRAIYEGVVARLQDLGMRLLHQDGHAKGDRWIALDYGGLLVHILLNDARHFYRLENMWENPKPVTWDIAPERGERRKTR
jgi:ribosome-associated protein